MRRRKFTTLLGGAAAAWPLGASAPQRWAVPMVGLLHNSVVEAGFVERRNIGVEFRLRSQAVDPVRRGGGRDRRQQHVQAGRDLPSILGVGGTRKVSKL